MKVYRTIGTVISILLTPVFILLLCAALVLSGAAGLVTQKSIDSIAKNAMTNEDIKSSVSNMLADSLLEGTDMNDPQMKETVDQLMELPSIQQMISGIVSESAEEITSGDFDGELDISEKLQDTITADPELLPTFSEDIVTVLLDNDAFRTSMIQSIAADDSALILGEELMDMLLQEPAVKSILAQVVTYTLEDKLGVYHTPAVDIAEEMHDLITENPTLAEAVVAITFPDGETFDAAIAEATAFANKVGEPTPRDGISKVEFLEYYLHLYRHNINDAFRGAIFSAETDQTDYAPDATPNSPSQANDMTLKFDEETVATLNEIAAILNIFKSPLFIVGILFFFVLTYLLTALLTWSFRYPLLFSGITAIFTGLLLIIIGMIPISDILSAASGNGTEALAFALVATIWGVLSDKLVLFGTVSIVLGIVLITVFIIIGMQVRNKQHQPNSANPIPTA